MIKFAPLALDDWCGFADAVDRNVCCGDGVGGERPIARACGSEVRRRCARELRDRWLETVNDYPSLLASGITSGKYDVTRAIASERASESDRQALPGAVPLLPSALAA